MLHVIAKSFLRRKFIFPFAIPFQKSKMKYRNISRNSCCEYSLTEIYDLPELATVCGCYIFRTICENLYLKGLFFVCFSAKETLNTISLLMFDCSVYELL